MLKPVRVTSMKLITHVCAVKENRMNDAHGLKGAFKRFKFGPDKHKEFSAAPTVDPTVACIHLNKRHVLDLAPVSQEIKRCTS